MNPIFIILLALVVAVFTLISWAIRKAEKEENKKEQEEREGLKKRSLEKYKDVYEKAIKEIDELSLKDEVVRYDSSKIPFFVAEAIVEHFRGKGFYVRFDSVFDGIEIHIG